MLSLEQCRQIEPNLKNLSDEEALEVIRDLHEISQLALENWNTREGVSKNPEWLLPGPFKSVK